VHPSPPRARSASMRDIDWLLFTLYTAVLVGAIAWVAILD